MKLKIQRTETIEMEVTLPLYLKHGASLYWIISEDIWIKVLEQEFFGADIEVAVFNKKPPYGDHVLQNGEKITAEYFNSIYSQSLDRLSQLLPAPKMVEEEVG
jgi:hypothetical protein